MYPSTIFFRLQSFFRHLTLTWQTPIVGIFLTAVSGGPVCALDPHIPHITSIFTAGICAIPALRCRSCIGSAWSFVSNEKGTFSLCHYVIVILLPLLMLLPCYVLFIAQEDGNREVGFSWARADPQALYTMSTIENLNSNATPFTVCGILHFLFFLFSYSRLLISPSLPCAACTNSDPYSSDKIYGFMGNSDDGAVCCPISCGQCGGGGCDRRGNDEEDCCIRAMLLAEPRVPYCPYANASAPCVLDRGKCLATQVHQLGLLRGSN